jgi:hypothetical protein
LVVIEVEARFLGTTGKVLAVASEMENASRDRGRDGVQWGRGFTLIPLRPAQGNAQPLLDFDS